MRRRLTSTQAGWRLLETALRDIGEVFAGQMAILLPDDTGRVAVRHAHPAEGPMDASELAVAQWVHDHRELAGLGTGTLPGAGALYLPLMASQVAVGALGMRRPDPRSLEGPRH